MLKPSLSGLASVAAVIGRAVRAGRPREATTAERLANLPLGGAPLHRPVQIRWDAHQIPSIQAGDEWDLSVALGVVHAHLRLAQMEIMRRLALGRVAEVVGPAAVPVDHSLRLMRFDSAVPEMIATLPERTRRWLDGFIAGVNHHIAHAPALPYEFGLLDVRPEPWTLEHLMIASRLAATDMSWMVFSRLLHAQTLLPAAEWDALWPTMQMGDTLPWPRRAAETPLGLVRGSNSAAVSAASSSHGAGLIASDPHLPITLPPLWLIAGLHAPGLDVVGFMIPGLPVVALGRNRALAWGGTSLHAASSDLVDVSAEPMTERLEVVVVRGRPPVTVRLRETRFGPVVSDGLLFNSARPLALRWVGHGPSDEFSAMVGVMHAANVAEFRSALGSFAVPGQTMTVVEAGEGGRAARVIAAHLPRRAGQTMPSLVVAPGQTWGLDDLVGGTTFPALAEATVASANDRPAAAPVPVGFFFSPPERLRRLRVLLDESGPVSLEAMRALQHDVLQLRSRALRDALMAHMPPPSPRTAAAVQALAVWDGLYDVRSEGALVFEIVSTVLARRLMPKKKLEVLSTVWTGRSMMAQLMTEAPPGRLQLALRLGLRRAAAVLRRHGDWGGVHQLSLRHPLAALPVVGPWFRLPDRPIAGGNGTLHKTGHDLVTGRHRVTFGSCARHVSDMADPDANWFVLLGGQDGWLGSENMTDQVAIWEAREAIAVPLQAETAQAWPYLTTLQPP